MGYEYFFINETKKEIIRSKKVDDSFKDKDKLISYICSCKGDTIRIVGEEDGLIENELYGNDPKEYIFIEFI